MERIKSVEAYRMSNEELMEKAQAFTYEVGTIQTNSALFDYITSMSNILIEIKIRGMLGSFFISREA